MGDQVTITVVDELGEIVETGLESIAVPPVHEMTLDAFGSAEDFGYGLQAPFRLSADPLFDPKTEQVVSLIVLVWYDAELNGALNLYPQGESETVRGLTELDADPIHTLSSLQFQYMLEGFSSEGGAPYYSRQWLLWGTDTVVGRIQVTDWSTQWTAVLESPTEAR